MNLPQKLNEIEKQAILEMLAIKKNNRTHTAKTLGIGIRTLQRKLKKYGFYDTVDPLVLSNSSACDLSPPARGEMVADENISS